ncbi:BON domain-containing protein [Kaarinaea lacus]
MKSVYSNLLQLKALYPGLFIASVIIGLLLLQSCSSIPDRRSTQIILKDENIESKATNELYGNTKINKKIHVNVTSYNGIVLVTGETLTEELRQQVIDLIRNLPDVKRVHNELVVDNLTSFESRSSDTWITSKVKSQMLSTKELKSTLVKVVTENDTVYLMGIVTEKEANMAVEVARNVNGVKRVVKIFEIIPEPVKPEATKK